MSEEDLKEQEETAPEIHESVVEDEVEDADEETDEETDEEKALREGWYKPEGWDLATVILGEPSDEKATRAQVRPVSMVLLGKLTRLSDDDLTPTMEAMSDEAVEVISRGIGNWGIKASDDIPLSDGDLLSAEKPDEAAEVVLVCKEGEELPLPRKLKTLRERRAIVLSLAPKTYNRLIAAIGFVSAS